MGSINKDFIKTATHPEMNKTPKESGTPHTKENLEIRGLSKNKVYTLGRKMTPPVNNTWLQVTAIHGKSAWLYKVVIAHMKNVST